MLVDVIEGMHFWNTCIAEDAATANLHNCFPNVFIVISCLFGSGVAALWRKLDA